MPIQGSILYLLRLQRVELHLWTPLSLWMSTIMPPALQLNTSSRLQVAKAPSRNTRPKNHRVKSEWMSLTNQSKKAMCLASAEDRELIVAQKQEMKTRHTWWLILSWLRSVAQLAIVSRVASTVVLDIARWPARVKSSHSKLWLISWKIKSSKTSSLTCSRQSRETFNCKMILLRERHFHSKHLTGLRLPETYPTRKSQLMQRLKLMWERSQACKQNHPAAIVPLTSLKRLWTLITIARATWPPFCLER